MKPIEKNEMKNEKKILQAYSCTRKKFVYTTTAEKKFTRVQ